MFLVVDLRFDVNKDELHAALIHTLKEMGAVKQDGESVYYGISSLAEDISEVEFWRKPIEEDEE